METLRYLIPPLVAVGLITGCNTLNSTPQSSEYTVNRSMNETMQSTEDTESRPMDETAKILADAVRDGTLNLDIDDLPEGTDVVIHSSEKKEIQEFWINGFLYTIKVTPKVGKPYFLVAADNRGNFTHAEQPQMLIPSWRIMEW